MVAIGVIGCGYNYLSIKFVLHRGLWTGKPTASMPYTWAWTINLNVVACFLQPTCAIIMFTLLTDALSIAIALLDAHNENRLRLSRSWTKTASRSSTCGGLRRSTNGIVWCVAILQVKASLITSINIVPCWWEIVNASNAWVHIPRLII